MDPTHDPAEAGQQQRAAALARWASLSPEQRRAATASATAAASRKAQRRAAREAEQQASTDRTIIARVRPDNLAEARAVVGPDATDRELVVQVLLVIKAHRAAASAYPDRTPTDERTPDDHRQDEEGAGRANVRPQELEEHRRVEGTA